MEKMNPVGWFEIPVKDMNRAKKFYESSLGMSLKTQEMNGTKMAWFPMEEEAAGAAGTLIQGQGYTPSHSGALVYFSVDDIDSTLKKIEKSGGKTLGAKKSIGEYGYIATFEDCEGNRVALHSMH